MYRIFYLQNKKGERFELTNVKFNQFFNDPNGLGYSKTFSSMRLGNVDAITSELYNLPTISGSILFYQSSTASIYQTYKNLIKFLTQGEILLYYQPPNELEPYFAEVNCIQIDKTEVGETDGILSCNVQFKMLTFWQISTKREISVTTEFQVGKKYPLKRPYYYGSSSLSNITVYNEGTMETPIEIEITGECNTPQINFYQNGEQYGAIKLDGEFDYVRINSKDDEETIELMKDGSVLANPLSYQDLSVGNPNQVYVTFVKLKQGVSNIVISFSSNFGGEVKLRWSDAHVSV